jgi:superfamily I DNA/RNA helicase
MQSLTLTHEQMKPVYSDSKLNICFSVPGSGKTTVLIARALRLYEQYKEPILLITFSNKAVHDIERRIGIEYADKITTSTIHAFCYRIVKDYWQDLKNFVAGPEWPEQPILADKGIELKEIAALFPSYSSIQVYERFTELRRFPVSAQSILRLYKQGAYFGKFSEKDLEEWVLYEKIRVSKGIILFEDMITLAEMLLPIPEVSIDLGKRFRHILIDEAQDTSESQWNVLRSLVSRSSTTLVVGDGNQSIYGFRGADGSVLTSLGFNNDALLFRLTQSFRSGTLISKLANLVCKDKSSSINSNPVNEDNVRTNKFESRADEVNHVLQHSSPRSAIITRTNSYLELFEREAILRGIPYSGSGFYRSRHIKELGDFLKEFAGSDPEAVIKKAFIENNTYSEDKISDFELVVKIIKEQGLEQFLELLDKCLILPNEGVFLSTGHGAKGLEWDTVFVVGAHEGHMPHKLSTDETEERNLFYVMTTRAKSMLHVTYVNNPSRFIPRDFL